MNLDWLVNLEPILNGTIITILGIGLILSIRAHKKSKETLAHLSDENERLRKSLGAYKEMYTEASDETERLRKSLLEADTNYKMTTMKDIVSKSVDAIAELQAQKISILSNPDASATEVVLSDVKKIDRTIDMMNELSEVTTRIEYDYHAHTIEMNRQFRQLQHEFQTIAIQIGRMANQISNTDSRLTILQVITPINSYEKVKVDATTQKQGLIALDYSQEENERPQISELPKLREQLEQNPLPGEGSNISERMRNEIELLERMPTVMTELKNHVDSDGSPDGSFDLRIDVLRPSDSDVVMYVTCPDGFPLKAPVITVEIDDEEITFMSAILRNWSARHHLSEIVQEVMQYKR